MKIGVSSYSFSRPIRAGKMTTLDAIVKAKEIGFDVIEFSTIVLPEGETLKTFAPKIKEKCEEVGIEVGNYTIVTACVVVVSVFGCSWDVPWHAVAKSKAKMTNKTPIL
jgi:sugar phosphate isomerase/epimerase